MFTLFLKVFKPLKVVVQVHCLLCPRQFVQLGGEERMTDIIVLSLSLHDDGAWLAVRLLAAYLQ